MLRLLLRTYPHTSQALFYQAEFPDGLYARVNVMPGSQDELILAITRSDPLASRRPRSTRKRRLRRLARQSRTGAVGA